MNLAEKLPEVPDKDDDRDEAFLEFLDKAADIIEKEQDTTVPPDVNDSEGEDKASGNG